MDVRFLGEWFCWHPILPDAARPLRRARRPDPPVVCTGFGFDRCFFRCEHHSCCTLSRHKDALGTLLSLLPHGTNCRTFKDSARQLREVLLCLDTQEEFALPARDYRVEASVSGLG